MRRTFYFLISGFFLLTFLGLGSIAYCQNGGVVSTLVGSAGVSAFANGTGPNAAFNWPAGIAVDSSDNLYVADAGNQLIRKITSGFVVTTFAGQVGVTGSTNGTGTSASFYNPSEISVDSSGNVYVADTFNNLIRKITPSGVVSTLVGSSGVAGSANGTGIAASFNNPHGVAVDSSGNVYVADTGNNLIRKITSGGVVTTLAGSAGVTGSANGTGSAASFNNPYGVSVDISGKVYVADTGNNLIRKITSGGVVSTLAGSGSVGSANGNGSSASFNNPYGVAVDKYGKVYVADTFNNLIQEITPWGTVTTLAGSGSIGSADGTGTSASFFSPNGVAVDAYGKVYVADSGNYLIRIIQ